MWSGDRNDCHVIWWRSGFNLRSAAGDGWTMEDGVCFCWVGSTDCLCVTDWHCCTNTPVPWHTNENQLGCVGVCLHRCPDSWLILIVWQREGSPLKLKPSTGDLWEEEVTLEGVSQREKKHTTAHTHTHTSNAKHVTELLVYNLCFFEKGLLHKLVQQAWSLQTFFLPKMTQT